MRVCRQISCVRGLKRKRRTEGAEAGCARCGGCPGGREQQREPRQGLHRRVGAVSNEPVVGARVCLCSNVEFNFRVSGPRQHEGRGQTRGRARPQGGCGCGRGDNTVWWLLFWTTLTRCGSRLPLLFSFVSLWIAGIWRSAVSEPLHGEGEN